MAAVTCNGVLHVWDIASHSEVLAKQGACPVVSLSSCTCLEATRNAYAGSCLTCLRKQGADHLQWRAACVGHCRVVRQSSAALWLHTESSPALA